MEGIITTHQRGLKSAPMYSHAWYFHLKQRAIAVKAWRETNTLTLV